MFRIRQTQLFCPYCREEHGREIKLHVFICDDKEIGYICRYGCLSMFNASYKTDYERGIVLHIIERYDPDCSKAHIGDWLGDMIKCEKNREHVYTNTYVLN